MIFLPDIDCIPPGTPGNAGGSRPARYIEIETLMTFRFKKKLAKKLLIIIINCFSSKCSPGGNRPARYIEIDTAVVLLLDIFYAFTSVRDFN